MRLIKSQLDKIRFRPGTIGLLALISFSANVVFAQSPTNPKLKCVNSAKQISTKSPIYQWIDQKVAQSSKINTHFKGTKVSAVFHIYQLQTCSKGTSKAIAVNFKFIKKLNATTSNAKTLNCLAKAIKKTSRASNWTLYDVNCKSQPAKSSDKNFSYDKHYDPYSSGTPSYQEPENSHGTGPDDVYDPDFGRRDPEYGDDLYDGSTGRGDSGNPDRESDDSRHGEGRERDSDGPDSRDDGGYH